MTGRRSSSNITVKMNQKKNDAGIVGVPLGTRCHAKGKSICTKKKNKNESKGTVQKEYEMEKPLQEGEAEKKKKEFN